MSDHMRMEAITVARFYHYKINQETFIQFYSFGVYYLGKVWLKSLDFSASTTQSTGVVGYVYLTTCGFVGLFNS